MLTNDQLSGKTPVVVLNKTIGQKTIVESTNAKVVKVLQGDRQGVYATVKFEDGSKYDRWIFAHDQTEDINYEPVEATSN